MVDGAELARGDDLEVEIDVEADADADGGVGGLALLDVVVIGAPHDASATAAHVLNSVAPELHGWTASLSRLDWVPSGVADWSSSTGRDEMPNSTPQPRSYNRPTWMVDDKVLCMMPGWDECSRSRETYPRPDDANRG